MSDSIHIPIFPLGILPIPGEMVPLHIFEQRYRDLLVDLEDQDLTFGILFSDEQNTGNIGGLVRLERILKRYETGESDIIVKCTGTFKLIKFFDSYEGCLYSGGDIEEIESSEEYEVDSNLSEAFKEYFMLLRGERVNELSTLDDIAINMNLPLDDKLKYLSIKAHERKFNFLNSRIKLQKFILEQEIRYKDSYRMN